MGISYYNEVCLSVTDNIILNCAYSEVFPFKTRMIQGCLITYTYVIKFRAMQ